MSNLFALKHDDGRVTITRVLGTGNIATVFQQMLEADPSLVEYKEIEESQIPTDRYFRNAWTYDVLTRTIEVDVDKAVAIKQEKLRAARQPLLENLDVEYLRADEEGSSAEKQAVAARKQILRDAINNLPRDLEELKAYELPEVRS